MLFAARKRHRVPWSGRGAFARRLAFLVDADAVDRRGGDLAENQIRKAPSQDISERLSKWRGGRS